MTALGCPQWRAQLRQGDYGQRQTPCMPRRARLPPSPLVFHQSTLSELDHRLASSSSISSGGTLLDESSFYSASPCYSASASLDYHSLSAPTSISSASSDWSHGRLMESQKQQLLQKSTWSFIPPTAQLSEILDRSARECLPYVDPVWPTLDPLVAQQEIDRDLTDLCKRFGAVLREEEGRPEIKREKYKTEMCRSWEEQGHCRYGDVCQFAHGPTELRTVPRHPKYKTELCRAFYRTGTCPYAKRCIFIHTSADIARSEGLHEHGVTKSPLFTRVGFQTAPELQQRQQQQHHAVSKSSPPKQHFAAADVARAESNLSATDEAFHTPDQELPYIKTNKTFLPSLDWLISHFLDRHARTGTRVDHVSGGARF